MHHAPAVQDLRAIVFREPLLLGACLPPRDTRSSAIRRHAETVADRERGPHRSIDRDPAADQALLRSPRALWNENPLEVF